MGSLVTRRIRSLPILPFARLSKSNLELSDKITIITSTYEFLMEAGRERDAELLLKNCDKDVAGIVKRDLNLPLK